ncbi:kappaPI-actitoxin-Avd3c-like [Odontomachus brunneus]|uniref:kappaPI-actitoxin-Avd3c-like n=1 Tax=Odontomachus brunneus TaxID=486640 RepID=UPI0013F2345D|nr:kappaPI-actitoxin-Avd3c-like [Odontomachus brunneus]
MCLKTSLLLMLIIVSILTLEIVAQEPEACQLPIVQGPCRAHAMRYAYMSSTNNCEQFVYGGCRGNRNNFPTKEDCEKSCVH